MLAWHLITKDQDYVFARPGLVAPHKRRKLELAASASSRRGNHGQPGADYNDKQRRTEKRLGAEKADHAYPGPGRPQATLKTHRRAHTDLTISSVA